MLAAAVTPFLLALIQHLLVVHVFLMAGLAARRLP